MDPSWLLGYSKLGFHAADKPISVPLKSSSKADPTNIISLKDLVRSTTPPCHLTPLIPGGHLQTIWSVGANTDVPIYYRRRVFSSIHPRVKGTFTVDFVCEREDQMVDGDGDAAHIKENPRGMKTNNPGTHGSGYLPPRTVPFTREAWDEFDKGSDDDTPMLIALHGLSGGSYELYLREGIWPLIGGAKPGQQKWKVAVVNSRGCAGSNITSGFMFNARSTWDVHQTVLWCREKFPNRPLFGVGFSLGANILTNYVGEQGEDCQLTAAVAISAPFDLNAGSNELTRSWIGREVYSRSMGTNLKKLFKTHQPTLTRNPKVNPERILAIRYLHEFDRELQGPSWGYPTEGAYYRDASSIDLVMAARIPFLAIHAEDDPVVGSESLPYQEVKQNPFTVLLTSTMGGHLGWFEPGSGRWYAKPTANFLRKFAEEVDLKTLKATNAEACKQCAWLDEALPFNPQQRKRELGC